MRIAFLFALANAATWWAGLNPGVKLRVDQRSVDATKRVLSKFLPKYLNIDLELPKEFNFGYESKIGLDWDIQWTDIIYSEIDLAMDEVKFELTQQFDEGLLKFDFPALKHWEITAQQHVNTWILPSDS